MPDDEQFKTKVDWQPKGGKNDSVGTWRELDLLKYNFESPWVKGRRIHKLRQLLADLINVPAGQEKRTLVILSASEHGPIAILNLLKVGHLAQFFTAVWTYPWLEDVPNGVYQEGGQWKVFNPPICVVPNHKGDILKDIAENPKAWLPQLNRDMAAKRKGLLSMTAESMVLVDDKQATASWIEDQDGQEGLLRTCKVTHYDESYRDCGMLYDMGGIGAHSEADYDLLYRFVKEPWEFRLEAQAKPLPPATGAQEVAELMMTKVPTMNRYRVETLEDVVSVGTSKRRGTSVDFSGECLIPVNDEEESISQYRFPVETEL